MGGSQFSKMQRHFGHGEPYMMEKMRRRGVKEFLTNPKAIDENGNNFLLLSCMKNYFRVIHVILQRDNLQITLQNSNEENALHLLLKNAGLNQSPPQMVCLALTKLLEYRNRSGEKLDPNISDTSLNSPLHYAAEAGLIDCCKVLVESGASLSKVNKDGLQPCDVLPIMHPIIAEYFETMALFQSSLRIFYYYDHKSVSPQLHCESLSTPDLQRIKDEMIVNISDMLSIPLFVAERVLKDHKWDSQKITSKWLSKGNNFLLPWMETSSVPVFQSKFSSAAAVLQSDCLVCFEDARNVNLFPLSCSHAVCSECWSLYLTSKIESGETAIICPATDCCLVIPPEFIEERVERRLAVKFLTYDIKVFVETHPFIRWCPWASCEYALMRPNLDGTTSTSNAVECANGHSFCWQCGEIPSHEPVSCGTMEAFAKKISSIDSSTHDDVLAEGEQTANRLWMANNSKNCPTCRSRIQKTDGCNHMHCTKCSHDFCWLCLTPWSTHGSATGGYYKCKKDGKKQVMEQMVEEVADAKMKHRAVAANASVVQTRKDAEEFDKLRIKALQVAEEADDRVHALHDVAIRHCVDCSVPGTCAHLLGHTYHTAKRQEQSKSRLNGGNGDSSASEYSSSSPRRGDSHYYRILRYHYHGDFDNDDILPDNDDDDNSDDNSSPEDVSTPRASSALPLHHIDSNDDSYQSARGEIKKIAHSKSAPDVKRCYSTESPGVKMSFLTRACLILADVCAFMSYAVVYRHELKFQMHRESGQPRLCQEKRRAVRRQVDAVAPLIRRLHQMIDRERFVHSIADIEEATDALRDAAMSLIDTIYSSNAPAAVASTSNQRFKSAVNSVRAALHSSRVMQQPDYHRRSHITLGTTPQRLVHVSRTIGTENSSDTESPQTAARFLPPNLRDEDTVVAVERQQEELKRVLARHQRESGDGVGVISQPIVDRNLDSVEQEHGEGEGSVSNDTISLMFVEFMGKPLSEATAEERADFEYNMALQLSLQQHSTADAAPHCFEDVSHHHVNLESMGIVIENDDGDTTLMAAMEENNRVQYDWDENHLRRSSSLQDFTDSSSPPRSLGRRNALVHSEISVRPRHTDQDW